MGLKQGKNDVLCRPRYVELLERAELSCTVRNDADHDVPKRCFEKGGVGALVLAVAEVSE